MAMSMKRRIALGFALGVVLLAGFVGFQLTTAFAPQRLEQEVRSWLEETTGKPVEIARLRLVMGFPAQLEADGLSLWDGALRVERASARLDAFAVLTGRPRLTRLRLEGAHLQVKRIPEGDDFVWSPRIMSRSTEDPDEPALAPLNFLGGAVRGLLERPLLADTLIVRRSRVSLAPLPGDDRPPTEFYRVNGRLLHSRLFGDARLFLRVTPGDPDGSRGTIEWTGARDPDGMLRLVMATSGLDLALARPYLRSLRSSAELGGTLDAIAEFSTAAEDTGDMKIDAVARDVEAAFSQTEPGRAPWRSPAVSVQLSVGLAEDQVEISDARIETGRLDLALDATLARPVEDDARARVSIQVADLAADVETARTLSSWLHPTARDTVRSLTDRIESGRIARARLSGAADLGRWRKAMAGRLQSLPRSFRLEVELDDVSLAVDPENRIDRLDGAFALARDNFTARSVTGDLNGDPLPRLDLSLSGFREFLMALPPAPRTASTAQALVGVTPLWEKLRPKDHDPRKPPPKFALQIDHLSHPALLWPVDGVTLDLELEPNNDGLSAKIAGCRWAGVVLDGNVDWAFQPERHMTITLAAATDPDAPQPTHAASPSSVAQGDAWATGSFRVGPSQGKRWRQRSAIGSFAAKEGRLELRDVVVALDPVGQLAGDLDLDLSLPDAAPYVLDAKLGDGDAGTLVKQIGSETEIFSGVIAIEGALRGTVVPERPLLHDADGKLLIQARDGEIQRGLPPLFAIAMAGESLNPFSTQDSIRYRTARGEFALDNGRISTEGLDIDGPDVRMFASGNVDLSSDPFALDAELALFLFRQIDWALGKIPILNALLLGEHENLVAAYFQLMGSWKKPEARMQPLRTLEKGPVDVLTKGIPRVVLQGVEAIGGVFTRPSAESPKSPPGNAELPTDPTS
jgi:hypothetical protein